MLQKITSEFSNICGSWPQTMFMVF